MHEKQEGVHHFMLFEISEGKAVPFKSETKWSLRELELEGYLIAKSDEGPKIELLEEHVFGEPLLLLSNQVRMRHRKRSDIIALDRMGNAVIIELKRDEGKLGVETQAMQYL